MSKSKIKESQDHDELDFEREEDIEFEPVRKRPGHDERINNSLQSNRVLIGGILGALLLGVGGYFIYDYIQREKQEEAEKQLFFSFKYYEQDSLAKAIEGNSQYPGLKKMVDKYDGTPAGELSQYMLGTAYLAQGKIKEGVSQLEDFKKKDDNMVTASAYSALAFAHEEQNQFSEAAEKYLKASRILENPQTSSEFLYQAARCFEEAKKKDKALETYTELLKKYPLTEKGQQAEKYIALLSN